MIFKKNHKFKRGLIIGPSGIGKVHIRQFLKNGICDLAILGKNKNKKRILELNLPKHKKKLTVLNKFSEILRYSFCQSIELFSFEWFSLP